MMMIIKNNKKMKDEVQQAAVKAVNNKFKKTIVLLFCVQVFLK